MRPIALALIAVLVLAVAAPALAQEEGGDEGTTETTVVDDGGAAVPQAPAEEGDAEQPWTSRFLPATIVALTVLVIGGAFLYYFFRIRGRYEVVSG